MVIINEKIGFCVLSLCLFLCITKKIFTQDKYMDSDDNKKWCIDFAFKMYLIFVASRVYFPIIIGFGEKFNFRLPKIWLDPIWSINQYIANGGLQYCWYLIVGNICLLIPCGMFFGYYYNRSFKKITIMFLLISIFIEVTQLIVSLVIPNTVRFFEINDIIFNTMGGVIGYFL
ncbi:MAG: VanZ family protein, partial [Clostridium sp.]|uniref:VanZ family protein n=1 Tax=Clostridium sp. TaxID=1506 RepID=UPI003EE4A2FC